MPSARTFRAVATNGTDVWAGGSGGALYHSRDAGNHWTFVVPESGGAMLTGDIVRLEFSDTQHGRVTTSVPEVWTTSDGGANLAKAIGLALAAICRTFHAHSRHRFNTSYFSQCKPSLCAKAITKVTFTQNGGDSSIHLVVWQFWGRAAEASWTEKSRTLFPFGPHRRISAVTITPAALQR